MQENLLGFWHRLSSNVRISWVSSTAFATVGTAVVTLVALPLLDVGMVVLLGVDLAAPDVALTGLAAALVAVVSSVAAGVVAAVVTDRNLGLFEQVLTYRRIDVAYWLAKAIVPALLAVITAMVVIAAVVLGIGNSGGAALPDQLRATVSLVPFAVLLGVLVGVGAAGIGVSLPDPYLGSTIAASLLPLAAGVIVPVALYPGWLQPLCWLLPGSGMVHALQGDGSLLWRDVAVGIAWTAVGLLCARRAVRLMREGVRREAI